MGNLYIKKKTNLMYQINKDITKLNHLINKDEFLMENVYEISNGIWHIIPYIEKDQCRYWIDRYGHYMMIEMESMWYERSNHFVYDGNYGLNSGVVNKIFDDKIITTKVLRQNNIKTPDELLLIRSDSTYSNSDNNIMAAKKFVEKIWYPIICKPLSDMKGNGVIKVNNENELYRFRDKFDNGELGNRHYIMQQYISWGDYRILYLDGEVIASYKRIPANIVWDGKSSINDLLISNDIFVNNIENIKVFLESHDYNIDHILEDKQILQILPTANLSTWGTAQVITLSPEDIIFVKKIAHMWWARYFWLDIITESNVRDGYVIEINKSPGIMGISSIDKNFPVIFGRKIWQAIKNTCPNPKA